ncbi:hypothetical protein [Streptomyces sp. NPDC001914]|uniref:hypothetical protein n=1 Tax=Streptomyces sp. NPDC001914 TaxID=3364623 RepID=UPI0036A77EBD
MSDSQQTHAEWQAEQHQAAQKAAAEWAAMAEDAHHDALQSATHAKENSSGAAYLFAQHQEAAEEHHARSDGYRQLAEMWARVATALTPPQAASTYNAFNIHGTLDRDTAAQTVDTLREAVRRTGVVQPDSAR